MSENDANERGDRTLKLLERELPEGYRAQWTEILAREREEERQDTLPVVVFRLGAEWVALSCQVFREFTGLGPVHRIPHRSDRVLLGITSVRGELHLAVSLHAMLEVEAAEVSDAAGSRLFQRMAVLEQDGDAYVAPIDEVAGLHHVLEPELKPPPVTVAKAAATHTRAIFRHEDRTVALLDEELLFYSLRRHVE